MLEDSLDFLSRLDAIDITVVSINIFLMILARPIMRVVYHGAGDEKRFNLRVQIFRAFNLAIIGAFMYYHMVLPVSERGPGIKVLITITILYVSFVVIHAINTFIHNRYGKQKEIDGNVVVIETYNSRLVSITFTILAGVLVIVAVVRVLGFESWLEAGGVLGVIGVFLALTQGVWAPDLFSGLIMLNSGMLETGDVIEFEAEEREIGVVHKTRLFHTELLNIVNNHRLMIRNAKLRDLIIHNQSKFASARGLREQLRFNIGYDVPPGRARKMFELAFERAKNDPEVIVESQHGIEVCTVAAGDYSVEYAVFFYTKGVRHLFRTRYRFMEYILLQAADDDIALSTPILHQAVEDDRAQPSL